MATYKRHTEQELEALSEKAYNSLADQITEIAIGMGIENAECMDIPELEDSIILRQTPINKLGHHIWDSKCDWKKCVNIRAKVDKLKDEILATLSDIADGYVKLKPVKVKYEDVSLAIIGVYKEIDYEEDETTLYCELKNPPQEYDFDWNRIEAQQLSIESLLKIISYIEDGGATIYSREERIEIIRRSQEN